MGLARTNSPIGKLIIRKIGDVGGPRSDLVDAELDNIIAWAKDAPREIGRNFASVGNTTIGPDSLHSFSLPANSLATDGDWVRVTQGGTFAANAQTKGLNFLFGGQTVETTGNLDLQGLGWKAIVEYGRVSPTSVQVNFFAIIGHIQFNAAGTFVSGVGCRLITRNQQLTALSNLNSNATTILVQATTGTATANNVTQNATIVELRQQ